MNIKKVDDKPMVIHTKEKTGLHIKGTPERKNKGRNISGVRHSSETIQIVKIKDAAGDRKIRLKKSAVHVTDKRKTLQTKTAAGKMEYRDENDSGQNKKENGTVQGRDTNAQNRQETERKIQKSVNSENCIRVRYCKTKAEERIKKKPMVSAAVSSAMAKTALDSMDGGNEVYEAYRTADLLAKPVAGTVSAGRNLCLSKAVKEKQLKIRKKQLNGHNREKETKKRAVNTTERAAQPVENKIDKETGQKIKISKYRTKTAADTGTNGITGRNVMDRRDVKNSTGNRMVRLFVTKLRQKENQDNIGKALKDIVRMRFSMAAKYIVRYVGLFLPGLFAVVALIAFPMIAVIAVIYNSPFAVFFPSISSGETTQEVLSAYVSEFNGAVNAELADYAGYDTSEKIYVGFEGSGTPDNFYDILMVYMVKHGDGDTATDMTDTAKQNLKAIFDDMCSYTVSGRTDTETDEEGNTTTMTVKEVNVELKTCYDMVSIYGFNAKEQEVLAQLMNPEYLAMTGYTGGGESGDTGEGISSEQYQAILDSISDENGRKVVAFALSKVGYPYSQEYRDSGNYYDCSSLAYYAWQNAGVDIMYEGSNTAASEGKFCYDNNLLVSYEEMQPGDLIFYSYSRNGRFMDITHVAVYVGDGKVVEAANTRLGVVYRPVQGRSSIVFTGRPR